MFWVLLSNNSYCSICFFDHFWVFTEQSVIASSSLSCMHYQSLILEIQNCLLARVHHFTFIHIRFKPSFGCLITQSLRSFCNSLQPAPFFTALRNLVLLANAVKALLLLKQQKYPEAYMQLYVQEHAAVNPYAHPNEHCQGSLHVVLSVKCWRSLFPHAVFTRFGTMEKFPRACCRKLRIWRKVWTDWGCPSPQVIIAISIVMSPNWVSRMTLNAVHTYLNSVGFDRLWQIPIHLLLQKQLLEALIIL